MRLTGFRSRRRRRGAARLAAALVGVVLLTAGCDAGGTLGRFFLPEPVTDQGRRTLNLWQGSWAALLTVGVIVWGLILYAAIFYRRRRLEESLPQQVRYNVPVEVLYTLTPLIVIGVFFFFTARDEDRIIKVSDSGVHKVGVVGYRWGWDFNYTDEGVYEHGTPKQFGTLYLPVGEKVQFEVTTRDVNHSFWVPAFLFKIDAIAGRVNKFEVTPERVGEYKGKCAELCGYDHSRMLFTTKIVPRAEYDAYIRSLRDRGQTGSLPPDNGPARSMLTGNDANTEGESRQ